MHNHPSFKNTASFSVRALLLFAKKKFRISYICINKNKAYSFCCALFYSEKSKYFVLYVKLFQKLLALKIDNLADLLMVQQLGNSIIINFQTYIKLR